ncbi:hypothetical protein [Tautonia rosea]|uniref:hypothetical protein n=1 Tax=Tautonia rosea TaxID=2728037 RepID=UPI001476805D|nr:hypothetical protein [Tautonia rosea]
MRAFWADHDLSNKIAPPQAPGGPNGSKTLEIPANSARSGDCNPVRHRPSVPGKTSSGLEDPPSYDHRAARPVMNGGNTMVLNATP